MFIHMFFHPSTTFSKRASLRRQRQHRILLQASERYSNTAILTQLLKKRLLCSDILLAIADVHSTICAMRVCLMTESAIQEHLLEYMPIMAAAEAGFRQILIILNMRTRFYEF